MKTETVKYICRCAIICVCIFSLSMCVAKIEPKHIYLETKTNGSCLSINLDGDGNVSASK